MSKQPRDSVENGPSETAPPLFATPGVLMSNGRSDSRDADAAAHDSSQLSEADFREAIENAVRSGLYVCDVDGHQTYVNPSFCKMVGWAEEELIGATPPYPYWPEDEVERVREAFDLMLAGEAPENGFELRFRRKNGDVFDAHVTVSALISQDGSTQGWLASVTDISDQKRVETELRIREHQLRFALGAVNVGTWDWNVATDEVQWSDNLEVLHHLPDNGLRAGFATFFDTIRADHRERVRGTIRRALEEGQDFRVEYPLENSDGPSRWIEAFGSTLSDESGSAARVAGVCIDISHRRRGDGQSRESETTAHPPAFQPAPSVGS